MSKLIHSTQGRSLRPSRLRSLAAALVLASLVSGCVVYAQPVPVHVHYGWR